MKKILYILAVVLTTSLTFSSCTEDDVTPRTELAGGGGSHDPL
jgi:hypothetical protein